MHILLIINMMKFMKHFVIKIMAKKNSTIINVNNTNNKNVDNDILTDKSCNGLSEINTWLTMSRTLYFVTIIFIIITVIMWTLSKLPIHKVNKNMPDAMNTKLVLKILLVLCYCCIVSSVFTMISLIVTYFYIPVIIVDAIILTDFKQRQVTMGPTLSMLLVNILVTAITIYNAFYSRTPGFTFVQWDKSYREDSDDSTDA
eukprot:480499_1